MCLCRLLTRCWYWAFGFPKRLDSRSMEAFLSRLPRSVSSLKNQSRVGLVVGNEAGDLDSVVCSVVWAFYKSSIEQVVYLPVLNFERQDLALRTEVQFCFNKLGLDMHLLMCLDDIEDWADVAGKADVTLVDHHVINTPALSPLGERVVEIVDHRPREQGFDPSPKVSVFIDEVGSCATLIAEKIFEDNPDFKDADALKLIWWTVLCDTKNMSAEHKKGTKRDEDILKKIEAVLSIPKSEREGAFRDVERAKQDVSSFNCLQMLRKDRKIFRYLNKSETVAVSSLPSPVTADQLTTMKDFERTLVEFSATGHHSLVIVLGAGDLVLYPKNRFADRVKDVLLGKSELKMQEVDARSAAVRRILRNNVSYTRKKLKPIIDQAVESLL